MHQKIVAGVSIVLVGIFFGLLFIYRETIVAQFEGFGLVGLFFLVLILDVIVQPISPDLLIFGSTAYGGHVLVISLLGGIASSIAGVIDYFLGKKLGSGIFEKYFGHKHITKGEKLFTRYGIWAVIVGALSPIPFSAVCWSAGIYHMRFLPFALSVFLTRVPRFLVMGLLGYSLF